MAKYILKAFFLTTSPSTQKKCPKIYAVTLVLPLKFGNHIKRCNPWICTHSRIIRGLQRCLSSVEAKKEQVTRFFNNYTYLTEYVDIWMCVNTTVDESIILRRVTTQYVLDDIEIRTLRGENPFDARKWYFFLHYSSSEKIFKLFQWNNMCEKVLECYYQSYYY